MSIGHANSTVYPENPNAGSFGGKGNGPTFNDFLGKPFSEEEKGRWEETKRLMLETDPNCYTPEKFEAARTRGEVADLDISTQEPAELIRYMDEGKDTKNEVRYFVHVYHPRGNATAMRFNKKGEKYPTPKDIKEDKSGVRNDPFS